LSEKAKLTAIEAWADFRPRGSDFYWKSNCSSDQAGGKLPFLPGSPGL